MSKIRNAYISYATYNFIRIENQSSLVDNTVRLAKGKRIKNIVHKEAKVHRFSVFLNVRKPQAYNTEHYWIIHLLTRHRAFHFGFVHKTHFK